MKTNRKLIFRSLIAMLSFNFFSQAYGQLRDNQELEVSIQRLTQKLVDSGLYNIQNAEVYVRSLNPAEVQEFLKLIDNSKINESKSIVAFAE